MESHVAEFDPEWRKRKISLWGAAKSLISQLRVGQDLTRVSLPSVFLFPFSILELAAYRALYRIHVLNEINKHREDPLRRMVDVVAWFLAIIEQEQQEKKPYNPVLGETHKAWVELDNGGRADFVCEQVCHHPPVCAYIIQDKTNNIRVDSNLSFGVRFGGNSVTVTGSGFIDVFAENFNEHYHITLPAPDMLITNVILPFTRRIYWLGELDVICPETGYSAHVSLKQDGKHNPISVSITNKEGEEVHKMGGAVGELLHSFKPDQKQKNGEVLFDHSKLEKLKLHYATAEQTDETSSLKVWEKVSEQLILNDLDKADVLKLEIENAQRALATERKANNTEFVPKYFRKNTEKSMWEPVPQIISITVTPTDISGTTQNNTAPTASTENL